MLVGIASTKRLWRVPTACALVGNKKVIKVFPGFKTKNIYTAVKISLFEWECVHNDMFSGLYCFYKCHALTCIGQKTIKYLILFYLTGQS